MLPSSDRSHADGRAGTHHLAEAAFEAGNALLGALRSKDRMLLSGRLQWRDCRSGDRLFNGGEDARTAYFPLGSTTIALSVSLSDGRDVHAAVAQGRGRALLQADRPRMAARCADRNNNRPAREERCNVSMIPARRARERQASGLHKTLADAQDVCTRTPRELSCDAKGATT